MARPVTIKGAERLMKSLARLEKKGAKRALRKATAAGGRVLARAVKAEVPVDDGKLKAAQTSKVAGRGMSVSAIVGADVAKLQADAADGGRPTNIDWLVEYGHLAPDGTLIPAAGYMRRAADAAMPLAEARFVSKLAEEIEREASK